jgi:hypothetical protein
MTHIHSDDCCVNMQYKDLGDKAPPPFAMWKYYLDQMIEALSEKHFTGQANFFYDDDGQDPMILVVVAAPTQDEMDRRFHKFLQARTETIKELVNDRS